MIKTRKKTKFYYLLVILNLKCFLIKHISHYIISLSKFDKQEIKYFNNNKTFYVLYNIHA